MTTAARVQAWRGAVAVTLGSGDLEATFLPELNLLGVSLRYRAEEYFALPGGIGAYRRGHTTGLPLLAPWANRLAGRMYRRGVNVDLTGLDLHTDAEGLPMHGTLAARDAWQVTEISARGTRARLRAELEYSGPRLLAAFPFPHRLETRIEVDGRSVSIATSLRPTGRRPVPVSFGYHPYLRLPGSPRSRWRLHLPRRVRLELDEHGIPNGRRAAERPEAAPLGDRVLDDLFELEGRTLALEAGGRRLSIRCEEGYAFAQVFAPSGRRFVCLEPMTSPTNALVTGACSAVDPGEVFTARFRIRPERTDAGVR